jgi:hypothetical protein
MKKYIFSLSIKNVIKLFCFELILNFILVILLMISLMLLLLFFHSFISLIIFICFAVPLTIFIKIIQDKYYENLGG